MAVITMRRVREGEVPRDGGTAIQENPDRPVFAPTAPTTTSASRAATSCAVAMHAVQMTKKVRIRCGRCSTVNVAVTDEAPRPARGSAGTAAEDPARVSASRQVSAARDLKA